MTYGFIKNNRLLDEKISDKDYLDIASSIETLSEKISVSDGNLMIGIIGAFGIGKSTLISKTKDVRKEKNEEWIHFDAWQFPERKELWEGLVLETAKQLSKLEETKRKIDGQSGKDKKLAVDTVGSIVNVATTLHGLPAILKPLFGLVKNLEYFADKSPAKRVFEIQDIFISLINSIDKENIIFVLEDTDRSGEAGLFFIETFKQFLSNNHLTKKVTVIVPISNASYYKNIDAYLKCLDYVEFFNKKGNVNLSSFVGDVFEGDTQIETDTLSDFLKYIFNKYPDMNMRKIKLILRQANLNYMELVRLKYEPNKLICIAISASKYINEGEKEAVSYFDRFMKVQKIYTGNEINRMIYTTEKGFLRYSNELITNHQGELLNGFDIVLVKRNVPTNMAQFPSTPYAIDGFRSGEDENKVGLPDFYTKDL